MAGFDAFAAAQDTVDDIENIVQSRINDATDAAEEARAIALDTIEDLKNTSFALPPDMPSAPEIDSNITIPLNLPTITPSTFGRITGITTNDQVNGLLTMPTILPTTIPDFEPSVTSISIPGVPTLDAGTRPTEPTADTDPTLPNAPSISIPALDTLATITIPSFTFPTLPTFDATAPEFEGSSLPPVFEWTEPTYATEVLDEALVVIRRMFAGGTGLPAAIENAIFERMNDREDRLVARAVSEAYTEWSDRGFTAPNGMVNARVDNVRAESQLRKQGANRELAIKVADIEVENLRFAVTQALAAEQVLVNIFLNSAERTFQAAKYQIQALVEIYNAQVSLFNARQVAYQTAATVYKVRIDAALSELEVYKAQIQGELAKAQVNESIVRAYTARVQALMSEVELYKARLEGAKIQTEISRTKIERYKVSVEAYATNIGAEKIKFDAYSAQIQGEAAKVSMINAQAQAYAAQIQGIATGVTAKKTEVEAVVSANEVKLKEFVALVERDKSLMQAELSAIQSAVAGFTADTQRYIAGTESEKAKAQLEVSIVETEQRTAIALYSALTASYNARMEQMIREASLTVEGLKSAGQIATTLAASAYAAVHVGATLSGGGALNASGNVSDSYSRSDSTSTNYNYNYEGT